MIKKGNLYIPDDGKKLFPWQKIRRAVGLPIVQPGDEKYEIHGYFVKDTRVNPPIAIFRDCKFALKEGTQPQIDDVPNPFQSVGEAHSYIKGLNLSMADEKKFRICALVPDPGLGNPQPNVMFVTKDELRK
jgi:hypothetical protein